MMIWIRWNPSIAIFFIEVRSVSHSMPVNNGFAYVNILPSNCLSMEMFTASYIIYSAIYLWSTQLKLAISIVKQS